MQADAQVPVVQGAVLVARDGAVLYEAYQGLADFDAHMPVSDQTTFQIASVSKQFTAAAILLLCEDGLLSLNASIAGWFPQCPCSWHRITIHHLLTHTSGLGHWPDYRWVTQARWEDSDAVVEAFYGTPPRSAPGREWYYSSPGYVLLAKLVERASAASYPNFLQRRLLRPAGMEHTAAGNLAATAAAARGYDGDAAAPGVDVDVLYLGAGDVWSTARDLLRWDIALANGDILSEASRSSMFTAHARTGPDTPEHYGYGWALGRLAEHQARYHTGDNPGYRALNAWVPELGVHLIVLSNQQQTDLDHTAVQFLRARIVD